MMTILTAVVLLVCSVSHVNSCLQYVPPPCTPCSRSQRLDQRKSARFAFGPTCCDMAEDTSSGKLTNATSNILFEYLSYTMLNTFTQECGVSNTRIVGGQDATENQFPWQCGILDSDDYFYGCGATIISCDPVIIVSAAHCTASREAMCEL